MAISEMTYDEMKAATQTHVCGVCGGSLNVAWSAEKNCHILRCRDINHSTIVPMKHRKKSEYEQNLEKDWKEINKVDSLSLTKMDKPKMLARIAESKFPQDLTERDKNILAEAAISYGFDPLMGEITIYQGRPFVSIDGRYRKAQETGNLDGVETRPATKEEKANWEIPAGDYFYRSEVWVKGSSRPFVGWGRVYVKETMVAPNKEAFLPVQKNPQRMAEKRAEGQALRKAFHIPLPSVEDIGFNNRGQVVDTSTGEVIEVTATVVEEKPKPETKNPPAEAPITGKTEQPAMFDEIPGDKASNNASPPPVVDEVNRTKLYAAVRKNRTALVEDKDVRNWLLSPTFKDITEDMIDYNPKAVWAKIKDSFAKK